MNTCQPDKGGFAEHPDWQRFRRDPSPYGGLACLQASWGATALAQSRTLLVRLSSQGALTSATDAGKEPILPLPSDSVGQTLRFRLFLLPPNADASTLCAEAMRVLTYDCLTDSRERCLGVIEFQPASLNDRFRGRFVPISGAPQASCQARWRPVMQEAVPEVVDAAPSEPPDVPPADEKKWLKAFGGSQRDSLFDVVYGPDGDIYVAGTVDGVAEIDGKKSSGGRGLELFVARLSPKGAFRWFRIAGSTQDDALNGIVLDSKGNVYVVGYISGVATFGSKSLVPSTSGQKSAFIAKLSAKGDWLWTKTNQGSSTEVIDIVIDANDQLFVSGLFSGESQLDNKAIRAGATSGKSVFVGSISVDGKWGWINNVPRSNNGIDFSFGFWSEGPRLALGPDNSLFLAGSMGKGVHNFGATQIFVPFYFHSFIARLDQSGKWVWVKTITAPDGGIEIQNILFSPKGNDGKGELLYLLSFANKYNTKEPDREIRLGDEHGTRNVLVGAVSVDGAWRWVKHSDASGTSEAYGLALDGLGRIYISGLVTDGKRFGTLVARVPNGRAAFVARLDAQQKWDRLTVSAGTPLSLPNPREIHLGEVATCVVVNDTGEFVVGGMLHQPLWNSLKATPKTSIFHAFLMRISW